MPVCSSNHSNISIPLFVNFAVKIKQFFLVLSRPEASSFGIDLAKIISNDIYPLQEQFIQILGVFKGDVCHDRF
jgi:hypothetical protein